MDGAHHIRSSTFTTCTAISASHHQYHPTAPCQVYRTPSCPTQPCSPGVLPRPASQRPTSISPQSTGGVYSNGFWEGPRAHHMPGLFTQAKSPFRWKQASSRTWQHRARTAGGEGIRGVSRTRLHGSKLTRHRGPTMRHRCKQFSHGSTLKVQNFTGYNIRPQQLECRGGEPRGTVRRHLTFPCFWLRRLRFPAKAGFHILLGIGFSFSMEAY